MPRTEACCVDKFYHLHLPEKIKALNQQQMILVFEKLGNKKLRRNNNGIFNKLENL